MNINNNDDNNNNNTISITKDNTLIDIELHFYLQTKILFGYISFKRIYYE